MNLRNILAFLFSHFLIKSGKIKKIKKIASNGEIILSVYFHNPSKKLFESCTKWFLKNGFHFISVHELNEILNSKLSFPKSAVLFTVDDGWKENENNIVSVADKYNIPVAIFISTNPVEKNEGYWWSYVSKGKHFINIRDTVSSLKKVPNDYRLKIVERLKSIITLKDEAITIDNLKKICLSPNVTIGSHTLSHPILTMCSSEMSKNEIRNSKLKLENWLSKDVKYFAYPNGEFSEREIIFLKESGYELAFSTVPKYITKDILPDKYILPRFDVLESVSITENICRMTGAWFNKSIN